MPRVAKVSREDAVRVIKDFATHFTSNELPPYTSQIWKEMSMQLNQKWSAHNVYIAVRENRNNILSTARAELGIETDTIYTKNSITQCTEESVNSNDSEIEIRIDSDCNNNDSSLTLEIELDVVLSENQWNEVKPTVVTQCGRRQRYFLAPRVWTNVFSIAIWKQHKLPCAFTFKRANVQLLSSDDAYELKIEGSCRSSLCNNKISVHGIKRLKDENGLSLKIKTRDVRLNPHETVKRPLNGKRRRQVQDEMDLKGCKIWQREQARLHMEEGDTVPPFIPNGDVLRNAKKEKRNIDLNCQPADGRDVIRTVENLSLTSEYSGLIHVIASIPFYTFYSTPAELNAYKEYCRIKRNKAVVCIDSTGSLVKKLKRSDGHNSGHIFLYSIVINFENTTLPVYQMLSEAHGTDLIIYWLLYWIRMGAPKPNIVVIDYSRALLGGVCLAFNNCTVKYYIEAYFAIANGTGQSINRPNTLVRIDVAHLTHMICRWKCFKIVRQSCIREFFIRCVSLMVDAKSIMEFQHLFVLTCAVAIQTHEDTIINVFGGVTTTESRKKLEALIADRNEKVDLTKYDTDSDRDKTDINPDDHGPGDSECGSKKKIEQSLLTTWLNEQKANAESTLRVGKNLNPFYLPEFADQLFSLAKEFPLWSNVAVPNNISHSSSSFVEGYFNDLKNRVLKNVSSPLRVDKFIKLHTRDILGQTLLFSSQLTTFTRNNIISNDDCENQTCSTPILSDEKKMMFLLNDSNIMANENWKGKGTNDNMLPRSLEDSFVDTCQVQVSNTQLNCTETGCFQTSTPASIDGCTIGKMNVINCSQSLDHIYCKLPDSESLSEKIEDNGDQLNVRESGVDLEIAMREINEPSTSIDRAISLNNLRDHVDVENKLKKKPSKYYESYPDIGQRNLLMSNTKNSVILPNGNLCPDPVKLDGLKVFVRSTCAFDSFVQILMTGALDDLEYSSVLEKSTNATMHFIWRLVNSGVTKEILQLRGELLEQLGYKYVPGIRTETRVVSYLMSAWDSIANFVTKAFQSCGSVDVVEKCSGCSGRTYTQPFLTPNHNKIYKNGFGTLEDALDFRPVIYNVRCHQCGSNLTLYKRVNYHIFIELDIRPCTGVGVSKSGLTCKISQLPASITLQATDDSHIKYRLIGLVTFFAEHFVAHCRRSTGNWQRHNDTRKKSERSALGKDVEPHLAVYLRQKDQE